MSISVSVKMDRKANLLAGRVVQENETIEVTPQDLGEHWKAMVEELDMSKTPPVVLLLDDDGQHGHHGLFEPTVAALRDYYQHREQHAKEQERIQAERHAEGRAAYEGSLDAMEAALAGPMQPQIMRLAVGNDGATVSYYMGCPTDRWPFEGVKRELPQCRYASGCEDLNKRRQAIEQRNAEAIKAENDGRFGLIRETFLARYRAEKQAEAEAEAAARVAKYAARLESGYWEMETSSYNERRYGAWWCASVTFPNGPRAVYTWGDSTGKWGKAGVLRVACRPGDIIAYGQKDQRRSSGDEHHIMVMEEDGRMTEVERTEAWKHWQKTHQEKAA